MEHTIKLLVRISNFFCGDPDLPEATDYILGALYNDLGFVRCTINLYNPASDKIFIHKSRGLTPEEEKRGIYLPGEGITGQAVEDGRVIVVPRIGSEPAFLNRTRLSGSTQNPDASFICVPVVYRKRTLGTINGEKLYTEPVLLEKDVDIISIFSNLIAQDMAKYIVEHMEKPELMRENERLHDELKARFSPGNIIGKSKAMREVYHLIDKISATRTTVLILGESGVGKELVASAIHYHSGRANGPLVRFSCAAVPESLIESELFGHEKGAFTGAIVARKGRFEEAHSGTLFLDEIGELGLPVQTKLLRVLQERVVERVGGNRPIPVDIRIITATNRDLAAMVKAGTFREDLYYRLNVFPMLIPPLRERGSDIIELADFFVKRYSDRNEKNIKRISTPALDMLMSYHWPGNVRELENVIERAVILSDDEVIHGHSLPPSLQTAMQTNTVFSGSAQSRLDALEYEIIIEALKDTSGNISEAAVKLGLTRRMLGIRLEKYGINYQRFRKKTGVH